MGSKSLNIGTLAVEFVLRLPGSSTSAEHVFSLMNASWTAKKISTQCNSNEGNAFQHAGNNTALRHNLSLSETHLWQMWSRWEEPFLVLGSGGNTLLLGRFLPQHVHCQQALYILLKMVDHTGKKKDKLLYFACAEKFHIHFKQYTICCLLVLYTHSVSYFLFDCSVLSK